MEAIEFMQLHADNAVAGKMPDVLKDLTPESMTQVGGLMAGAAQPFKANKVEPKGQKMQSAWHPVTVWICSVRGNDGTGRRVTRLRMMASSPSPGSGM